MLHIDKFVAVDTENDETESFSSYEEAADWCYKSIKLITEENANVAVSDLCLDSIAVFKLYSRVHVKEEVPLLLNHAMMEITPREEELEFALQESLKFQTHYASLLNVHDGGERITEFTVDEWIKRTSEKRSDINSHRNQV